MLEHPTTIVLGAGASVEYGYPVGSKLRDQIIGLPSVDVLGALKNDMGDSEIARTQFRRMQKELSEAPNLSIDSFLETRNDPNYLRHGALAIAAALMPYERNDRSIGGWYRHLFNAVATRDGKISHKLVVITFNYDRSLEVFFERAFQRTYGVDEPTAFQLVRKHLEVIHVYGDLGELTDPANPTGGGRAYGESHPRYYSAAAARIRLATRDQPDPADQFGKAYVALQNASCRIILGFGFDRINVQRLRLNEVSGGVAFSSGYGLSVGHRTLLRKQCYSLSILFGGQSSTADQFLEHSHVLGWLQNPRMELATLYNELRALEI